jgi:cysteine-rich repeat protein
MDSGDGCNVLCTVESGWVCSGEPSECEVACGNGDVDAGEDCDGTNLNGKSCASEGFAGGDLSCDGCSFDTTACLESICPNGTKEGSEGCDGTDFGGQDCTSFGFAGGDLSCTGACEIVTTACVESVCGNNVVETGEQCDDDNATSGDGCSETCQWENTCTADATIACGGSDSQGGTSSNDVDSYTCSTLGDSSERVYALTIPAGITSVTASLTCDSSSDDYDLYVMEACNPSTCAESGTESSCDTVTFSVTPGQTYYLSVEEYDAFWGGYTLDVTCS